MTKTMPKSNKSKRQVRIYSGRVRRMIYGDRLKHPCIFLHFPKCGGTSLSEALYASVPMHQRVGVIDAMSTRRAAAIMAFGKDDAWLCHDDLEHGDKTFALREGILLTHLAWDTRLIHGHVLYTDLVRRHFADQYKLISIMRHPVERTISNYRMAVNAKIADPDPDVWLDQPISRQHTTTYLRYLSGNCFVPQKAEKKHLKTAIAALDDFGLIGFLEQTDKFVADFHDVFGARLNLHQYNRAKGEQISFSKHQMTRIEELCASDIEIYDAAKRKF